MKKILLVLPVVALAASFALAIAMPVFANPLQDSINTNLTPVADKSGLQASNKPLPEIIGNVIKYVLGFLGIVMVCIVLYAGFLWMTAGGESDQVKKAKDWMLNAVIGLIIIIAAYAISNFVIEKVFEAMQ